MRGREPHVDGSGNVGARDSSTAKARLRKWIAFAIMGQSRILNVESVLLAVTILRNVG